MTITLDRTHIPLEMFAEPLTSTAPQTPSLLAEYAIRLPHPDDTTGDLHGIWWRKLSTRVADPNGTTPTLFSDRPHAEDEWADTVGQAIDVFGLDPRVWVPVLMVRSVTIGATVTRSDWRPVADQPIWGSVR